MNGENLQLRYMTWPEIKEKKENNYDTIIISLGAMEQHGLHLPECTDETIGTGLACGLAKKIKNSLVAPTIIPGLSTHHMSFPGSLTLRPHIFKGVVEDYISSYYHHGMGSTLESAIPVPLVAVSDSNISYPRGASGAFLTILPW